MPIITRELKLYTPHAGQLQMHESRKRYRVGVWGRQSGKSTWGNNELLNKGWRSPTSVHWFVGPTNSQALQQYRRGINCLRSSPGALLHKNKTEKRITLLGESALEYKSGEVFDNLRGETLHGVVIDEVRDQKPDLWEMVIRPMLTTTGGWGAFIGTPNGFDSFYELIDFAKKYPDEWDVFHHPSTINPLFTLKEYEAARRTMTDKKFRQEILAEFVDLTAGKAYFAFSDKNIRDTSPFASVGSPIINRKLPIVLAADFNINPMSWALGQNLGRKWYWFDEIRIEQSNTPEAARELVERLNVLRDQGVLNRNDPKIIICGDAAGKGRSTKTQAGESDYDLIQQHLKRAGISYIDETPDSNPLVKDRVNAVNDLCESADGTINMWVNPKCEWLIRDLRRVTWKDGTGALDKLKDPSLTHMSDAIGYPIHKLTPVADPGGEVGLLKVVY